MDLSDLKLAVDSSGMGIGLTVVMGTLLISMWIIIVIKFAGKIRIPKDCPDVDAIIPAEALGESSNPIAIASHPPTANPTRVQHHLDHKRYKSLP